MNSTHGGYLAQIADPGSPYWRQTKLTALSGFSVQFSNAFQGTIFGLVVGWLKRKSTQTQAVADRINQDMLLQQEVAENLASRISKSEISSRQAEFELHKPTAVTRDSSVGGDLHTV